MVGLLSELTAGAECIVWWSCLMEGASWALLTCTLCNMKHYCARSVWSWAVRKCIDWWWERTTVLTLLSDHLLWVCPNIIFWSWYPDVLYGICAHTLGSSLQSDHPLSGAPLHPDSWFWFHDNLQDICVCNNQPVIVSPKRFFHPSLQCNALLFSHCYKFFPRFANDLSVFHILYIEMRIKLWQEWKNHSWFKAFFNGLRSLSPFGLVQTSGYPSCDN